MTVVIVVCIFTLALVLVLSVLTGVIVKLAHCQHAVAPPTGADIDLETVREFSVLAGDIAGFDHTPGHGAHLGPLRSARAMAIVHVAMGDAVAAATGAFEPYLEIDSVSREPASVAAAAAVAAFYTLRALYPAFAQRAQDAVDRRMATIANGEAKTRGIALGTRVAERVLAARANDGADHVEPTVDKFARRVPGVWQQDPISKLDVALGGLWAKLVAPFVIDRADQFRLPPPPALESAEYAMEYYEVKALGGRGTTASSTTTRDEWRTFVGNFWAYDGTPSLCAPPRLYIQLMHVVADRLALDAAETARALSLLTLSMADAGLAAWDSKYHYMRERPVTAVRWSATKDNNDLTVSEPDWEPLGAPATNTRDPNFTPPFPAYPSGHATFGGAATEIMRQLAGTDTFPVPFVSDEYNGTTHGSDGLPRPYQPRTFASFSEIAEENAQSRIYLGIHWASDKLGTDQGVEVARLVAARVNRLLRKK